jgi:hypothetical protein
MEQIENMEIVNPDYAWVIAEFEDLYSEWLAWKKQVADIVDQPYNRNTESGVFADGKDMMLKHDVLQAKTLTFLNNNIRGHGFIRGFDGQHIDRTDLRLKVRVEHRMRDLEVLRAALLAGYARSGGKKNEPDAIQSRRDTPTNLIAKFKEHWFILLVVICAAVSAATWTVSFQVLVSPRDFEIARLNKALAEAQAIPKSGNGSTVTPSPSQTILTTVGVRAGDSVTTPDGACTVHILSAVHAIATLEVAIDADPPKLFTAKIGNRIVVRGSRKTYYIDLHGERGGIVDLSVSSVQSTEASLK